MSWLSEGLSRIGISKDTQRAAVGVAGTVLAPATGGLSAVLAGVVSRRPGSASGTVTYDNGAVTTRYSGTFGSAPEPFYKSPLFLLGAAAIVVIVAILLLRRK